MLDALVFSKTPQWLKALYPECQWKVDTDKKVLYLTFDDGPIPEVTTWVLDELKKYKAKATFFCIGKNIDENPEIFKRIIKEGHGIGNHTYNHYNGWKYVNREYYENIQDCARVLAPFLHPTSDIRPPTKVQPSPVTRHPPLPLFRPPYGKLKPSQYKYLKDKYRIVMWDVLTLDYNLQVSKTKVLNTAIKHAGPGSIIVFHDSIKAQPKMQYALPKVLEHFSALGYTFAAL